MGNVCDNGIAGDENDGECFKKVMTLLRTREYYLSKITRPRPRRRCCCRFPPPPLGKFERNLLTRDVHGSGYIHHHPIGLY